MAITRLLGIVAALALLSCDSVFQSNSGVLSFSPRLPFSKAQRAVQGSTSTSIGDHWPGVLHAAYPNSGEASRSRKGPWKLSNDFNIFLTQCSIQSFIFLVNSLRDRNTALWLEEFTCPVIQKRTINQKKNDDQVLSNMAKALQDSMPNQLEQDIQLLSYHGLGALNTTLFPTWDSYFEKLLDEESFTYLVQSTRSYVPTYELEINPASLCARIISVREQIAREFAKDLDVIADMSENMLETYFEGMKWDADAAERVDVGQANLLFLQLGVGPDLQTGSDYKPSPLRSGNFDLLILMATQESIHRVLNDAAASEDITIDKSSVQFLRNFYSQRLGTHFTGSNWYGRADGFLEELLATSPSVVQLQDEVSGLVDPVGVVRAILKEREQVSLEWLELALDVPQSHASIKRRQLNKLMGVDNYMGENSFQ
jgi:hypothetical protein